MEKNLMNNHTEAQGDQPAGIPAGLAEKMKEWTGKKPANSLLFYPLISVEFGMRNEAPFSQGNQALQDAAALVYAEALRNEREIVVKKFHMAGFSKYLISYQQDLVPWMQEAKLMKTEEVPEFEPEVEDEIMAEEMAAEAKREAEKKAAAKRAYEEALAEDAAENAPASEADENSDADASEKRSTEAGRIADMVDEAVMHPDLSEDEAEAKRAKEEADLDQELQMAFVSKIFPNTAVNIPALYNEIDAQLYDKCLQMIRHRFGGWSDGTKSPVFDSLKGLEKVLAFFYYQAELHKFDSEVYAAKDLESFAEKVLMRMNKEQSIAAIANISGLREDRVRAIVEYLTNDGRRGMMEFPLYEANGMLYSIPSLWIVNDWKPSVMAGHRMKKIRIQGGASL